MNQILASGTSHVVSAGSKVTTVRTVIPKSIRQSLDLKAKDKLHWNVEYDGKKLKCYIEKEV